MQKPSTIILGIDPGMVIMGYSIIEIQNGSIRLKEVDVLKLPVKKDNYQRLQMIHKRVQDLVEKYKPNEFAIEAPFFGKNVQSMLKLGRAQGVAIAAAMSYEIPVTEYSPRKIKQSITGTGTADKEQVWQMLQRMINVPNKPKYFDATDALAVAVCHYFALRSPLPKISTVKKKGSKGWEKFAHENPNRVL